MNAPDPAGLARADDLVRQGQLPQAADLLAATLDNADGTPAQWLQLAGLRRALRQPRKALDAVHRALALAPYDFMGLVLRAGLLERLGDPAAGQAWSHALAQKPDADLPPPLAEAVRAGEAFHAQWLDDRGAKLAAASAGTEARASEDEARRIARLRDNVLRKTRVYRAEPTHYHYPGLAEWEFYPRHRFPELEALEAATADIREELHAVMRSDRAELVPYLEYPDHAPLEQWQALNRNPDWTAIHLLRDGERVEPNASMCPKTLEAVARFAQPHIRGASPNLMFSLLAPNKAIPPHLGVNNARLLCHLPLIVPDGCWFRVGAETRFWREGEAFVFDDTIEHEAMNPTDHLRVVMIFDLWHPDLSALEREAIAAIVAADEAEPGLHR